MTLNNSVYRIKKILRTSRCPLNSDLERDIIEDNYFSCSAESNIWSMIILKNGNVCTFVFGYVKKSYLVSEHWRESAWEKDPQQWYIQLSLDRLAEN